MTSNINQNGDLIESKRIYTQLCNKNKDNKEHWFTLGHINGKLNMLKEAEFCYRNVLRIDPNNLQAIYNIAYAAQLQGNLAEAVTHYKKLLNLQPGNIAVLYNIAICLQQNGDLEGAEIELRRALNIDTSSPQLHGFLAGILYELDRPHESMEQCKLALELKPDYAEVYCQMGRILSTGNKTSEAILAYNKAIEFNSLLIDAYIELAYLLGEDSKLTEIASKLRTTLSENPNEHTLSTRLGDIYYLSRNLPEAVHCYEYTLSIDDNNHKALLGLGLAYELLEQPATASNYFTRAYEACPNSDDAVAGKGRMLVREMRYEKARRLAHSRISLGSTNPGVVDLYANTLQHLGKQKSAEQLLIDYLSKTKSVSNLHIIHYRLANILEKKGSYDRAFKHYTEANTLSKTCFSVDSQISLLDDMITGFSKQAMERAPRSKNLTNTPVFIVGMPRSGTTLVEQILDSHPDIHGAGELRDINNLFFELHTRMRNEHTDFFSSGLELVPEKLVDTLSYKYTRKLEKLSTGCSRVVDKLPQNFIYLGFIQMLFPNCRVIHCIRSPLDTCISIFCNNFEHAHAYANDLSTTGLYYKKYTTLMKHWKDTLSIPILDIQYEELVANQESLSKELIEFCGVDWDDSCLLPHENKRTVNALNQEQICKPIHQNSVSRWKHFEQYISPLINALGDSAANGGK